MTGQDVKRQVMEALTWDYGDSGGAPAAALAPCVVLTGEEAAKVREHMEIADNLLDRRGRDGCYALLTPPEHPSVPADHLADVQEAMADKALAKYGDNVPAPGEGDDLPNPEVGMEC